MMQIFFKIIAVFRYHPNVPLERILTAEIYANNNNHVLVVAASDMSAVFLLSSCHQQTLDTYLCNIFR